MALDLEILKKHPYATGGIVIIGAIVVFYLLSSSSGGGQAQASTSGANNNSVLAANTQLAQIQAAATVQTNAQQAQLQAAQLQADTAKYQVDAASKADSLQTLTGLASTLIGTNASVSENATNVNAQTTQQANQLLYAQNIQQMQDGVLESQINSSVLEHANDNATQLAGYADQLDYGKTVATLQAGVATQGLADATTVATTQANNQYKLASTTLGIVQQAGLNHGTQSLENSLTATVAAALNQPAIGVAAENSAAASSVASSSSIASIFSSIGKLGSSVLSGAFA